MVLEVVRLDPEYLDLVYRFRYQVYIEELGLTPPEADHLGCILRDSLDECSNQYALLDNESVVGSLRSTFLDDVADLAEFNRRFRMGPALRRFGRSAIGTTSRFMIAPKYRGSKALLHLMEAAYGDGRARGIRLNYGDCSPHMLPFYLHVGYRMYETAFMCSSYGLKIPLLMIFGDISWFQQVRSPLRRIASRYPDDAEARSWFEETYADPGRPNPQSG
jgi:hypothetical protein